MKFDLVINCYTKVPVGVIWEEENLTFEVTWILGEEYAVVVLWAHGSSRVAVDSFETPINWMIL